jgi:hypothetical protein
MPSLADAPRIAPTSRPFRADPPSQTALSRAIARARLAPWRVRAVTDPGARRAIRDAHLPHWTDYLRTSGGLRVLASGAAGRTAHALRAADALAQDLHELPLHLVVLARAGGPLRDGALGTLVEALRDEGLDGALLPLGPRAQPALCELLALPAGIEVAGLIAARSRR